MRGLKLPAAGLALALVLLTGCLETPAITDDMYMRGHFKIPQEVNCFSMKSRPEKNSPIFKRENLCIKAIYKFDPKQFSEYYERVKSDPTWYKLPISERMFVIMEQIDRFRECNLKQFDALRNGYYHCETATGKDIMMSVSLFACPPSYVDKDFLLAVLDVEKQELRIVMKQDY